MVRREVLPGGRFKPLVRVLVRCRCHGTLVWVMEPVDERYWQIVEDAGAGGG